MNSQNATQVKIIITVSTGNRVLRITKPLAGILKFGKISKKELLRKCKTESGYRDVHHSGILKWYYDETRTFPI